MLLNSPLMWCRAALCIFACVFFSQLGRAAVYDNAYVASLDKSVRRSCDQLQTTEESISTKTGLKALYSHCVGPSSKTIGIVVYVNGGPGLPPSASPKEPIITFLMAGFDVVEPIYFGTGARAAQYTKTLSIKHVDNVDEISTAILDVRDTIRWARSRYDNVILAGSSAGGYIAAASCLMRCADGILMIAPKMQSADEFWRETVKDNPSIIPIETIRAKDSKGQPIDWSKINKDTINEYRRAVALGFYGTKYRFKSLIDVMDPSSASVPKLIVVGSNDDRVGLGHLHELANVAAQMNLSVRLVEGAKHEDGLPQEALASVLSFLAMPASGGKLPNPAGKCVSVQAGFSTACR